MYALVDCNNFFVSAERVFRPDLRNRPVCVLSNNDGCIVALSNEAKAIGLARGNPLFKVRDIVARCNVTIFSANFSLYAGMSSRVMHVMAEDFPNMEIYSIDEAFLPIDGLKNDEILLKMRELKAKLWRWTGIPVSIGIAQTKTLAKVAGHYAKKFPGYQGVCMIDSEVKRQKALQRIPVSDIWGIGRQSRKKLDAANVFSAWDFTQMSESWVQQHFGISGVKTRRELNGIPCVEASEIETKQSICTSRSFGKTVAEEEELLASIVEFTTTCAQKLRAQHSVANMLSIFISTDRFKEELPQYKQYATTKLTVGTADTSELIGYAKRLLAAIFRPGFQYKRAGVILAGITDDAVVQQNLFDGVENRERRQLLFQTIDKINQGDGGRVKFAIQGQNDAKWRSRKEFCSPNYLGNIDELMKVK